VRVIVDIVSSNGIVESARSKGRPAIIMKASLRIHRMGASEAPMTGASKTSTVGSPSETAVAAPSKTSVTAARIAASRTPGRGGKEQARNHRHPFDLIDV